MPATAGPDGLLADYLSEEQLAVELDVTVRTLIRWHNLGIGPPRTMVGRTPRYRRGSTQEWLRRREETVEETPSRSRHQPHRREHRQAR